MKQKRCPMCKTEKPTTEFYKGQGQCKICRAKIQRKWRKTQKGLASLRNYQKFFRYGLRQNDIEKILERQDGKCDICGKSFDELSSRERSIDHCHETGKVRGILCRNCNVGLGYFRDSVVNLSRAIEYLQA